MKNFIVTQISSGIVLWEGEAANEEQALDLMARSAGYTDYKSMPDEIGGGDTLLVTENVFFTRTKNFITPTKKTPFL